MNKNAKIYIAGHTGLVGSALMRALEKRKKFYSVRPDRSECASAVEGIEYEVVTRSLHDLDLRNQTDVNTFFDSERPDYVILAAAKVGGIGANMNYPAEFIYDNLMIEANVINAAYRFGVEKLLFLGSSCIYPRTCPQPIKEEYLLSSELEPTNEPYAIAKIAGIKMCQAYNAQYGTRFISAMPTNLYGPHDLFDEHKSHVIPALISKFVNAKERGEKQVTIWGTGNPRREFLYVDDCAQALLFLLENYEGSEIINVGTGEDITIKELAYLIKELVGFTGDLVFDDAKPDGTPRKLLSVDRLRNLGWKHSIQLRDGLERTIRWYQQRKVLRQSTNQNLFHSQDR